MVCEPLPATLGSNVFPLIPGPLKRPPGTAGVNVELNPFSQYVAFSPVKLASGAEFTVTVISSSSVQPLVVTSPITVYVVVTVGLSAFVLPVPSPCDQV